MYLGFDGELWVEEAGEEIVDISISSPFISVLFPSL